MAGMAGKDKAAIRSIQAIRDKSGLSSQRLALELYESSGRRSSVETYQRRFSGCFNAERDQDVFEFWEVVAMMKLTGIHDPLDYICSQLGYKFPDRISTEDQERVLQSQLTAARDQVAKLEEKLNSLRPSMADQFARFSRFPLEE